MATEVPELQDRSFGGVGPGSRIAGYRIEERIGSGGMAVVFRAVDEVLGRMAAVKIIAPQFADDRGFRTRFLRESRLVAKVDSPHIIPVYAAGKSEGRLYLATRYVPGGDLAALLRRSGGTLAPGRAGALVTQVASALDAAHAAHLVHRDVKPQNILVDHGPDRPEHAYLSDFGLSKVTKSSVSPRGASTRLTLPGQFLGTPDYAAPEQVKGEPVDGRTDQYALACVAFFLLTGLPPFERDDTLATIFAHAEEPVPSLTGLRPELPAAVDATVARALAKSPADRYATCGEFAVALEEALIPARTAPVRPGLAEHAPAEPAASDPAPESPASSDPALEGPAAPDPASEAPAASDSAPETPAASDVASAAAAASDPATATVAPPKPARPGPRSADPPPGAPATTGPATTGPAKAGSAKARPAKAGPGATGPAKAGPAKAGPAKAGSPKSSPAKAGPAKAGPPRGGAGTAGTAKNLDQFAWLARQDGNTTSRTPPGQPVWLPPGSTPRFSPTPPVVPSVPPRDTGSQPERATGWQQPALPRALTDSWEAAIRQNAAYPKVVAKAQKRGWQRQRRGRNFWLALVGAAAVILAAGGAVYALNSPASAPPRARPSKPAVAATFTVPGGDTIDTAWVSPDGKFVAAGGLGPSIYVWNTAEPKQKPKVITPPLLNVGGSLYSPVAENLVFSADDSTLTAVIYPNVPSGVPTPGGRSIYYVYQWKLAGGPAKGTYHVQSSTPVAFSDDNRAAVTSAGNVVSLTVLPSLATPTTVTLPGGVDKDYTPPFQLDQHGDRMIYHPAADETFVWDFKSASTVARFKSSAYTVLSPDGKVILAENPTDAQGGAGAGTAPALWDIAKRSYVTPSDPLWKQQLRQSWKTYSWNSYSTDGSVLATKRAGGQVDLWSADTRKHLLTVTDQNAADGHVIVGPGGSEVLVLAAGKKAYGQVEYRQIRLWETPLAP